MNVGSGDMQLTSLELKLGPSEGTLTPPGCVQLKSHVFFLHLLFLFQKNRNVGNTLEGERAKKRDYVKNCVKKNSSFPAQLISTYE